MEFFNKAKSVRLISHLDKYLVADSDEQSVRQTSIGGSPDTRWTVEFVKGKSHVIRLKSCHGKYLTAGDEPFLLGMTGKKVVQSCPTNKRTDNSVEWEPIKDGYLVKLRTRGGKFLRANGGTLPWRNSITHDVPHRTATQDWVLWAVEMLGVCSPDEGELVPSCESPLPSYGYPISRFSPFRDEFTGSGKLSPSTKSDGSSRQLDGMVYFVKAKYVRLQSHNGKYLVADTDKKTVRQSHNGSSERACWTVELVTGKSHAIRLKSCHDLYLTASYDPFLLGMTGKKVHQSLPSTKKDPSIEWEPIIEVGSRDSHVKLKSVDGKFLRANGGTPPWRNSITHDVPRANATQGWIWWGVEALDNASLSKLDSRPSCLSPMSSFSSSFSNDFIGSPDTGLPMGASAESPHASRIQDGMKYFHKAKTVRLQSHHDKYLVADDDENTVRQSRNGSSPKARWTVEFVNGKTNVLRLKSCHGLYLTATNVAFLLGMTGKKVIQSLPASKMDPSIEWEPIKEVGSRDLCVKLRSTNGKYLRANGGTPPWNNSITHDVPHRTTTQDWILWGVDVLDISLSKFELVSCPSSKSSFSSSMEDDFMGSPDKGSPLAASRTSGLSDTIKVQQSDSFDGLAVKADGRIIHYNVADDNGNFDDGIQGSSFHFKGHSLEELTQKLEQETGLEGISVCSRNPLNGKLYPLRLALPPNNASMHIVVVPSTT